MHRRMPQCLEFGGENCNSIETFQTFDNSRSFLTRSLDDDGILQLAEMT